MGLRHVSKPRVFWGSLDGVLFGCDTYILSTDGPNEESSPKNLIMPCVNLSIIIGTGVDKDKSQMEEEADATGEEEAREETTEAQMTSVAF